MPLSSTNSPQNTSPSASRSPSPPLPAPLTTRPDVPRYANNSRPSSPQSRPDHRRTLSAVDIDESDRRVTKRRKVSDDATAEESSDELSSTELGDEPLSSISISDSMQPSQEQETVASPSPPPEAPSKNQDGRQPLSSYVCPVCFSAPTNACALACGHVFCGSCLFAAVKSGIRRGEMGGGNEGIVPRCPICRLQIHGWDGHGGGVIGLKPRTMLVV